MRKHILILFLFFSYSFSFSQIDIKKLEKQIATYNLVDSSGTAFSLIQKTYASPDSTELYIIIYDSNGAITNPPVYGSATRHDELDVFGRILNSTPYLANGEAAKFITYQYVYFDSIPMIQINHISYQGKLISRLEKEFDKNERLIEKRLYDKFLHMDWRITYEFDDVKHLRYEKSYDSLSNITIDECGVALKVQQFPPSGYKEDRLSILEERFYDLNMNLVDCSKHYGYSGIEPYSIVQRIHEGNKIKELRFNAKNELIFEDIIEIEK